jgi:hypothetical protein
MLQAERKLWDVVWRFSLHPNKNILQNVQQALQEIEMLAQDAERPIVEWFNPKLCKQGELSSSNPAGNLQSLSTETDMLAVHNSKPDISPTQPTQDQDSPQRLMSTEVTNIQDPPQSSTSSEDNDLPADVPLSSVIPRPEAMEGQDPPRNPTLSEYDDPSGPADISLLSNTPATEGMEEEDPPQIPLASNKNATRVPSSPLSEAPTEIGSPPGPPSTTKSALKRGRERSPPPPYGHDTHLKSPMPKKPPFKKKPRVTKEPRIINDPSTSSSSTSLSPPIVSPSKPDPTAPVPLPSYEYNELKDVKVLNLFNYYVCSIYLLMIISHIIF